MDAEISLFENAIKEIHTGSIVIVKEIILPDLIMDVKIKEEKCEEEDPLHDNGIDKMNHNESDVMRHKDTSCNSECQFHVSKHSEKELFSEQPEINPLDTEIHPCQPGNVLVKEEIMLPDSTDDFEVKKEERRIKENAYENGLFNNIDGSYSCNQNGSDDDFKQDLATGNNRRRKNNHLAGRTSPEERQLFEQREIGLVENELGQNRIRIVDIDDVLLPDLTADVIAKLKEFPKKNYSNKTCYECETCHKKFTNKSYFRKHLKIHAGELFECEFCPKKFKQRCYLTKHLKFHTKKNFECETCHKKFVWRSDLVRHLLTLHGKPYYGNKEKPFECEICHKKFIENDNLIKHLKIHNKNKFYECEICHEKFIKRDDFVIHLKIHNKKIYECDICRKKCIKREHLLSHLKIHNRTVYECEICNSDFFYEESLLKHLKTHDGDKNHKQGDHNDHNYCERLSH